MSRSGKTADGPAGAEHSPASAHDDIEGEFLGIWLGLARLREKVRHLTAHDPTPSPSPRQPV